MTTGTESPVYNWLEYDWEEVDWSALVYTITSYDRTEGMMISDGNARIFVSSAEWEEFQDMFPDRVPFFAWASPVTLPSV